MYAYCMLEGRPVWLYSRLQGWYCSTKKRHDMRSAKGSGHLFKRGDYFYLQIRSNGRQKSIALHKTEESEARIEANKYRALTSSQTIDEVALHVAQAKKLLTTSDLPLNEVWKAYEISSGRPDSGKGTLKNYKRMWKDFKDWANRERPSIHSLSRITTEAAKTYASGLWKKEISAGTYNQYVKALRLICRVLGPDAGLSKNPFAGIVLKTETKQSRKDFSPEQVQAILAAFDNPELKLFHHESTRVLFFLGAYTGLRLETAALLTWDNVDFKRGVIKAIPKKTIRLQREVIIPLHSELKKLMLELHEKHPPKDEGHAPSYVMPDLAIRYLRRPAGIKGDILKVLEFCKLTQTNQGEIRGIVRKLYGFHSFRHYFASNCANAGVPITTLAEILGDNISTLQRYYLHAADEGRQKALAALPGAKASTRDKLLAEVHELAKIASSKKLKAALKALKQGC